MACSIKSIKPDGNKSVSHESIGSKIVAKIKIYIFTRENLLIALFHEIPYIREQWRHLYAKLFWMFMGSIRTQMTLFS